MTEKYITLSSTSLGCTLWITSSGTSVPTLFLCWATRVVSFQVTDSGYQPSWQIKNNSAGAISPTSDLCLCDNSSLRFLSLHYCVPTGLTQGSRLVPLSTVSIKTCGDIKEVTSRPPQQCLMFRSLFWFRDGKMLEKCSSLIPATDPRAAEDREEASNRIRLE